VDEAERLHAALCSIGERLAEVVEDARFEQRDGYCFMTFPTFPLPSFNGVWAETDSAAAQLEDRVREVERMGLPFGATVRAGRTPAVEETARSLGLTAADRVPGMAATPGELGDVPASELQIIRVETADGLAQALAIAAAGFQVPAELLASLYMIEVSELDGIAYYLARRDGRDVSTAVGYTIDGTVGIFNVATPAEHRGRGYGATITAHAARDGFAAGADLAWLQSSAIGESVYRRLGFREVETYLLLTRPARVSPTS
jgi:ribosomal protein S18 acetylase RimI-like enzyme